MLDHDMRRPPACARNGRSALLARREEFVAGEGMRIVRTVAVGAGVPGVDADVRRAAGDPGCDGARHAISITASTSVATLCGSEPAPTAARACLPASPNT